jgi:hypothetical protein
MYCALMISRMTDERKACLVCVQVKLNAEHNEHDACGENEAPFGSGRILDSTQTLNPARSGKVSPSKRRVVES